MHALADITTGEWVAITVAVIAINVAILMGMAVLLQEWVKARVENYLKEHEIETAAKANNQQYVQYSLEAIARYISTVETDLAIQAGILCSLVERSTLQEQLPKSAIEYKRLHDELRKALQEVFLVSDSSQRRFAAIQELSNQIGDADSLEKMKMAQKFFLKDPDFETGIKQLEARLAAYGS